MRWRIEGFQAAAAIGGAACVLSTTAAAALIWPNAMPARMLSLAATHEARAHALSSPVDASASDLASAQQETLQSLRQGPANPTAWLRLAYIDSRAPQGLGNSGITALNHSYAVAPFGPDDTGWRLRFAFNHWSRLDADTRVLALAEYRSALAGGRSGARGLLPDIKDPAGRLAVYLTAQEHRRASRQASDR